MITNEELKTFLEKNLNSEELQSNLVEFTFDETFVYLFKNDRVFYFDYNNLEDIKELLDFIKTMSH